MTSGARVLRLVLAALTLGAVVGFVLWDTREKLSPGPLHPTHEGIAELRGTSGCAVCHDAERSMSESCATCHEAVAAQAGTGLGLHGALAADVLARCGDCHVEHHGVAMPLVGDHAFALAGVPDRNAYDHAHLPGFGLAGAHDRLSCAECHTNADVDTLPAGEQRFLGLDTHCTACHDDPHAGAFGAGCADCHGQDGPFAPPARFDHARFPLRGVHARTACAECHPAAGPHAIATLRERAHVPLRGCADCHADPHIEEAGAAPRFDTRALACSECHGEQSFSPALVEPSDHRRFASELAGAHARLDCAACHSDPLAHGRSMSTCSTCHADPHAASSGPAPSFSIGDLACTACHVEERFSPATTTAAQHASFGIELAGVHARASCTTCHLEQPAAARAADDCAACHDSPHSQEFVEGENNGCASCHDADDATFSRPDARITDLAHARRTGFDLVAPHDDPTCTDCHGAVARPFTDRFPGRAAGDCAACHTDPHQGAFDDGPTGGRCVACHEPHRFVPSAFDVERHASATRFPLDGAHAAVPCSACHERPADGAPAFSGTPVMCSSCHADPHDGRFDSEGLPREIERRLDCARCHQTTSFRDLHAGAFDHARWTGHELVGAHARASCATCHGRRSRPDAEGRTLGRAPNDCAACHTDPHAGQFATDRAPGGDCARCHDPASTFADLGRFDHTRDTAFALDARHAALSCDACHRSEQTKRGTVTRYRPLGTECTDCHGSMRGEGGRR